ncbi:MAG TPA: YqaJ viral recombinase family protein [Sedimentisphaerales bacterium]|nr:YqaJ viral recombinase family protein [Sedimentisphaerales bacterium]
MSPINEAERLRRKGYIGSSDMAAILGFDQYSNAYNVWLDKTNRTSDFEGNKVTEAGTIFEPGVMDWAEKQLGPLRRNVELFLNEFHMIDHVDGQVILNGNPVEAKTAGLFGPIVEKWGEDGTDRIPDRVLIQCHHHMICAEREICHVPAFIGRRGFNMFEVGRDQLIVDTILEKALDFWDCVENDTPPENMTPSLAFIKRIKRVPEKVIDFDAEQVKLIKDWQDAKGKVKWAGAILEDAQSAMLTALGDAEAGKFALDGKSMMLTYFEQCSRLIDVERLRKELPEIAAKYTKASKYRVTRLKKIKREYTYSSIKL